SSQLFQCRDVAGKLRGRQTGPAAPAQLTVGADDFPEPVAEQRSRAFGLAVEVDAVDVLEALGRDLSEQRAKPVVKVELVGTAQNDQPVDPIELVRQCRFFGLLRGALERRTHAQLRLEDPKRADERAERDRCQEEHIDPHEQRPPTRRDRDEGDQDRRQEREADADPHQPSGHAAPIASASALALALASASASVAARSACRLSIASIASAFMPASISCGLKRARSNSAVSLAAASRPPLSSPSTLPRYSWGASDRCLGMPCAASDRSIRTYAAITARRGSLSARRSSSVSARTSDSTSATCQPRGSRRRRPRSATRNAAKPIPAAPRIASRGARRI